MSITGYIRNRLNASQYRRRQEVLLRNALLTIADFPGQEPARTPDLDRTLTVSLTSYPARFEMLDLTLKSLLMQSIRPDRIVLWIGHKDIDKLPAKVLALQGEVLAIMPCEDLRSYTKLIPALEQFPDDHIVTTDDDLYYSRYWLERLVSTHRRLPNSIVCSRAHLARFRQDGSVRRYNDWEYETLERLPTAPDVAIFPTGVGGVLYPARCMPLQTLDRKAFKELAPAADDVWFFWMARINGVDQVRVEDPFDIVEWPDSQKTNLNSANVMAKGNDAQLQAMERAYGRIGGVRR